MRFGATQNTSASIGFSVLAGLNQLSPDFFGENRDKVFFNLGCNKK
jgi:hypothetical protein